MRQIRILAGIVLAACALTGTARAQVHECPLPGGGSEYRDAPCAHDRGRLVEIAAADGVGGLYGDWCEHAVSLFEDSKQDTSTPAQWTFTRTQVRYRLKAAPSPGPWMPLKRLSDGFSVDNGMFGGVDAIWRIVRLDGGIMVVEGPWGGYFHFRRGGC